MTQKNSFISLLEQIAILNKNSVEIITKLNNVVSSTDSNVSINYLNQNGEQSIFNLPTVGYLKKEIDIANTNIQKLASLDNNESVFITDGNSSKKIKSIDLNREPKQIPTLDIVSSFSQKNNWFFESLMNPLLTVNINLAGKIDEPVKKILSKRYILQFEKDSDGNYTSAGLTSLNDFSTKFLYKNSFSITNFETWLNNPTNTGVLNTDNENLFIDEQLFDVNYKEVNYKGYFSVLKIEKDTLNKKLWYHVNSLTYYDRDGGESTLAVGDILSINKKSSYTRYKILEVNTSSSLFRLNLERFEGYDPVGIGTNILEFYSSLSAQQTVNVTIGFDEYNVVFMKPINTETSIIGSTWSKGMAYYTNDLTLDTDDNVSIPDFYLSSVYDYGALLKDLVIKKIPSSVGKIPNNPTLLTDNFKVVQINKHLTETKDKITLKKLHGQKNSVKTKLNQLNDAIIEKNRELNTKNFKSIAEKSQSQNELDKLITKQESETKLYTSYVNQINNTKTETISNPKFRIRGYWSIPDSIVQTGQKVQNVIGFELQWRYGSKYGTENITEGYETKETNINFGSTTSSPQYLTETGYFSNWNKLLTDVRERTYDEITNQWIWEIQDISDADTPNINQLDIAIQRTEKVEIRIKSISEVGYPDTPLYSDWSNLLTIEFPDDLNDVLGENEFILKEASQEEIRVQFENELNAKGINKHVQNSFYVNEEYFAHDDKKLATSFKDSFGNTLSLFDYLKLMNDKITNLEEAISRAKGELKVTLFKGTRETVINNGAHIQDSIECQDYMIETTNTQVVGEKEFENNVYMISDYYLKFENIATQNPLSLLTDKLITDITDISSIPDEQPSFIDQNGDIFNQMNNQFIWLLSDAVVGGSGVTLYSNIIASTYDENTLNSPNTNYSQHIINKPLLTDSNWKITSPIYGYVKLGATIHPKINNSTSNDLVDKNNDGVHLIDAQSEFIIPLNLYFKSDIGETITEITIDTLNDTSEKLSKSLRFMTEPENSARSFDFTLTFEFNRFKKFTEIASTTLRSI